MYSRAGYDGARTVYFFWFKKAKIVIFQSECTTERSLNAGLVI